VKVTDKKLASLANSLGELLKTRGARIACAESCTGGWISKTLTDVPGSSEWFELCYVVYANDAKKEALGVTEGMLSQHGAVSRPVVVAMAKKIQQIAGSEFSVAVSGVAGPGGGTVEKPVGTVWFAYGSPENIQTDCCRFDGDRESVRRQCVERALRQLFLIIVESN
tara:strand:- start:301 stop:801 length:501 start_codon:yes stop_codon:yes gene_type:complete